MTKFLTTWRVLGRAPLLVGVALLAACSKEPTRPDATTGTLRVSVTETGAPSDPNGYELRVGNSDPVNIFPGTHVLTDLEPGEYSLAPDVSPNGSKIVFARQIGLIASDLYLYVINIDGTGERLLVGEPGYKTEPRWSPDGDAVMYRQDVPVGLWRVGSGGGTPVGVSSESNLAWWRGRGNSNASRARTGGGRTLRPKPYRCINALVVA
jgi:Tol biopolymer transport system component